MSFAAFVSSSANRAFGPYLKRAADPSPGPSASELTSVYAMGATDFLQEKSYFMPSGEWLARRIRAASCGGSGASRTRSARRGGKDGNRIWFAAGGPSVFEFRHACPYYKIDIWEY